MDKTYKLTTLVAHLVSCGNLNNSKLYYLGSHLMSKDLINSIKHVIYQYNPFDKFRCMSKWVKLNKFNLLVVVDKDKQHCVLWPDNSLVEQRWTSKNIDGS